MTPLHRGITVAGIEDVFDVRPLHERTDANAEMSRGGSFLPPPFLGPGGEYFGHEWSRWRTDLMDERVDHLLDSDGMAGRAILDLGCATGAKAAHFAQRGHRVTAVDIGDHAAEIAARNRTVQGSALPEDKGYPIEFQRIDLRSLPLDAFTRRFDLVHARRLINFMSEDALAHLFSAVERALNGDGLFVASFIATGISPPEMKTRSPPGFESSLKLCPGMIAHRFAVVHHLLHMQGLTIIEGFSDRHVEAGFIAKPAST